MRLLKKIDWTRQLVSGVRWLLSAVCSALIAIAIERQFDLLGGDDPSELEETVVTGGPIGFVPDPEIGLMIFSTLMLIACAWPGIVWLYERARPSYFRTN